MGGLGRRHCVVLIAAVVSAPAAAFAQAGWWNDQWPFRRAVTVSDVPQTSLPGEEVGVVTMPTGGSIQPGGGDIRVTTAGGVVVPHRVLMCGPGDVVRLAFGLRRGSTRYFVYFGNAKPDRLGAGLDIRRGLLLETRAYAGGPIANLPQVQRAYQAAGELLGRDFRERIFLGHNPFGPQNQICNLFSGYLVCPADGEYIFSTSSQDASFLLVDGQLVVSNGGRHPPQPRAVQQGRIRLVQGLHELKVYHVNTTADPVAVAAWQGPRDRSLWAIPPEAFAPIRRAQPGMMERRGRAEQADFLPVHAGESFMANRYFQRYLFELLATPAAARGQVRWDFGDGQTSSAVRCEHVYLRNGLFKVTLTVKLGGQTLEQTNRVFVSRPWDQVILNKLDPLADHARIASGYEFTGADARDVAAAISLFQRAGMSQAILRAGQALVQRPSAHPRALAQALPVYAEALAEAGQAPRAVAALLKGAEMSKSPDVSAELTTRAGRAALAAGDLDKALGIFEQAIRKYSALTTVPAIREAHIGVGDVWRQRGDYGKAAAAYQAAAPLQKSSFEKSAVRRGDLARQAEDYIRRGLLADASRALDELEYEFPAERLEGFSALLRVKLELAWRHYAAAAEHAELLVRVNPRSSYAAELLMLASQAYRRQAKAELSRAALERIVKGYPESPLAAQAKAALAKQ